MGGSWEAVNDAFATLRLFYFSLLFYLLPVKCLWICCLFVFYQPIGFSLIFALPILSLIPLSHWREGKVSEGLVGAYLLAEVNPPQCRNISLTIT